MAATTLTKPDAAVPVDGSGAGPGGFGSEGSGGGGGWGAQGWSVPARAYRTGMWMAISAITMLFAAFTSAMVVRRGLSNDWAPTRLPEILYLNTLVLIASSITLEGSRRSLAAGRINRFARGLCVTLALGFTFIAGQLIAWRQLASQGVYLATNPSSSFFFLLTGAHGIHLLGGIIALLYLVFWARKYTLAPRKHTAVDVTAMYWHFMDGLWIYLLLLMSVRL
jgi:cytochrome c oxidase subunit III